jgi:hypothetical protein
VYSTPERDKFRTRLERTNDGGSEIYLSHRGMIEVYVTEGKDKTMWQPRPADPELEAEFLRRLMVRLGAREDKAKQTVAAARAADARVARQVRRRARTAPGAGTVSTVRGAASALRSIASASPSKTAIARRDCTSCAMPIRKPAWTRRKTGSSTSSRSGAPTTSKVKAEQYRVQVRGLVGQQRSVVLTKDGNADQSATARRILSLPARAAEVGTQHSLRLRRQRLQGKLRRRRVGETRLLLDCGLSPEALERRLERLGVAPSSLCAILITHEHDDHAGHAYAFAAAHGLRLFMTHGTRAALDEAGKAIRERPINAIRGGLDIRSTGSACGRSRSRTSARAGAIRRRDGRRRPWRADRPGCFDRHVEAMLSGIEALVLECNHDLDMLWAGSYPSWLKKRIAGPFGHLNNGASQQLLAALDRSRLQHVIAAHLSQQNNKAASRARCTRLAARLRRRVDRHRFAGGRPSAGATCAKRTARRNENGGDPLGHRRRGALRALLLRLVLLLLGREPD